MRHALLTCLAALACFDAHAGIVNLPAEAGSPLYVDDWSIPSFRCHVSVSNGVAVYDGADRCAMVYALPVEAGRKLKRVKALYEDDDASSQLTMQVLARNVVTGNQSVLAVAIDNLPSATVLESLWTWPEYVVPVSAAPFLVLEVQGNTRLKAVTYEWQ